MSEKLQKVLARAGLGSRREMETQIEQGRVSVNGHIVTLGTRVEEGDKIRVDGHLVDMKASAEVACRVLAYHKPEGELCTRHDPEGRPTVFDRLPILRNGRWIAVGRLDINTSGLLLFTNDGELANRLMHPSHEVEREYSVRVFGDVMQSTLHNLRHGVMLEDGEAKFKTIKPAGGEGMNQWFDVILTSGRNREVRRLWESQGVQVSRLIRTRYGNILMDRRLPRGGWVNLELEDINYLRDMVSLKPESKGKPDEGQKTRIRKTRIRTSVRKHNSGGGSDKRRKSTGPQKKRTRM